MNCRSATLCRRSSVQAPASSAVASLRGRFALRPVRDEVIKQHAWNDIAPGLSVTASIGLAQGPHTLARALQVADTALYRAKREGRDRVVRA